MASVGPCNGLYVFNVEKEAAARLRMADGRCDCGGILLAAVAYWPNKLSALLVATMVTVGVYMLSTGKDYLAEQSGERCSCFACRYS